MGWGPGKSRVDRPQAPLPEADPALAADQDRPRALHPLLPLRALQPGGRRGRAAPAPGAGRVDVRRHLRRPPLHRPLPRQHHRALPGGGADLGGLPVPGPPLGHRGRRLGLHALPEPVQRDADRARRAHRARPRPRQPRGRRRLAVRQGAVRLPDGRVRASGSPQPLVRQGGELRPASWDEALEAAAAGLRAGRRADGRDRRRRSPRTRRATWRSGSSAGRSARRTSILAAARRPRRRRPRASLLELSQPELARERLRPRRAPSRSWCSACDPLHAMPILDLRIRKVVRRNGTRLAVATDRPSALDGGAEETARYAPGLRGRLPRGAGGASSGAEGYERAPGELGADAERIAGVLKPGSTVIVWGGRADAARCVDCAAHSSDGEAARGPGRRQRARPARGRLPPGRRARACPRRPRAATRPRSATASPTASLEAAFLVNADPVRDFPDGPGVERGARQGEVRARGLDVRGRLDQARRRRLPGRVLRREGGHRHPPRRPPPAPAPRRPAPGRRAARCGRCWSSSPPCSATRPGSTRRPRRSRRSPPRSPSTPGITHEEIGGTRRPLAGARSGFASFPQGAGSASPGAAERQVPTRVGPNSAGGRRRRLRRRDPTGHLPRPLGGRGDRSQPGAAVPGARADARAGARGRRAARARAGRRGRRALERDQRAGAGRDPRAGPARAGLPDRGHRRRRTRTRCAGRAGRGHEGGRRRRDAARWPTRASSRRPGSWS